MTRIGIGGEWVYIGENTGQFAVKIANWEVLKELFSWTDDDPHVGYSTFSPRRKLPKSCIESAEFAIQLHHNPGHRWRPDQERKPHVTATFGGGTVLDVTSSTNLVDDFAGVASYPFTKLPKVGQGVIIANRAEEDADDYNMHLGATVARHKTKEAAILTDLAESGDVTLVIPWSIKLIRNVDDFRGDDYVGSDFALGLLK